MLQKPLRFRHQIITEEDVACIRKIVADNPGLTRSALAVLVCQARNWVQPNGALRDLVCRNLMLYLEREGRIELPPVRSKPLRVGIKHPKEVTRVEVDQSPLRMSLSELGDIELSAVRRTAQEPLFNSLVAHHHYLGYVNPVGESIKYLIRARGRFIACAAFSSAPRHLASRDHFHCLERSGAARLANIRYVAYNTRFLILPWVQVPHLASHLLARLAATVSEDWQGFYAHPLYFLETFIDFERFRGTCYHAANWVEMGETTGRGNNDQTKKVNRSIKKVLGLSLVHDFRERLCKV